MEALCQLKQQGKIRAVGLCNFSRSQLEKAATCGQIDSLQIPYSLFWRQAEKDLIPYCIQHEIWFWHMPLWHRGF
uniref:aldo/keto reductase n=1 Tax=Oscillatoria sp. FACHB-1407 TaxID=2692847 RepID=UPI0018F00E5B|nr:aldo/keto reductase [Oscillatoria sp. FACHB-1407]